MLYSFQLCNTSMKEGGEEEIGGFFFFFENPLEEIRLKREEIKLTNNNNMQIAFGSPIQRNTNLFFFFFVEKKNQRDILMKWNISTM